MSPESRPVPGEDRVASAERLASMDASDRVAETLDSGEDTTRGVTVRANGPQHRASLGIAALAVSALCVLADGVAVAAAAAGHWGLGTTIAEAIMVAALVPFALGIVAIAFHRGRGFAVAAVTVSVLAHPLVLTGILTFLHG
jgi:hypothetical protein